MFDDAAVVIDRRAAAFTVARRKGIALAGYPGAFPRTEAEAYAIQDGARRLWRDRVVGWKVGLIQPPHDAALGRSRLFGPIFAGSVIHGGAGAVTLSCIAGGFAAVEAEYVLRLGVEVPPRGGWTAALAAPMIDAVLVGVELAGSPFAGINDHGPLVTISDFGNNAGLVVGGAIADGLAALEGARCSMAIDGQEVGQGGAGAIPGGPLQSVVELLNHMGRGGEALPAGTLVSTGAATGVHQIKAGQHAVADFGVVGRITVCMEVAGA